MLTNGQYYIFTGPTGKIMKTVTPELAEMFSSLDKAKIPLYTAQKKTRGFYAIDAETQEQVTSPAKRSRHSRRAFSQDVRHMVYDANGGRCYLCGKPIKYEDMTLDHIKPLAMGGRNTTDNLACACFACNQFKGSVQPEEFHKRVSEIYFYQTEKSNAKKLRWRLARKLLISLAEDDNK